MTEQLTHQIHEIEILMNIGEFEEAISQLLVLMNDYPDNYYVTSLLGECYLSIGEPEKAIKPLEWATKNYPKRKLNSLKKGSRPSEKHTISVLKRMLSSRENKGVWVDHYLLGCALGRCMEFKRAIVHLNKANTMSPNNSEIVRNLGWIQCMNENERTGRALLMRALSIDPQNALAHNDLGASYLFAGDLDQAKKWIDKALALDPDDPFIVDTSDKLEELRAYKKLFGEIPVPGEMDGHWMMYTE